MKKDGETMTTNRMGLTPELAANSLTDGDLRNAINLANNDTLGNAFRELLAYREASKEPVADVVAWSSPNEERTCDIRWRRHDVQPGPLYTAPPLQAVTVPDEFERKRDAVKQEMALGARTTTHRFRG